MILCLYNNLICQFELFILFDLVCLILYVCGFMVYNYVYIGNVCGLVVFGVLVDLLWCCFGVLCYVCNIIDVDDKINIVVCEQGVLISIIIGKFVVVYCEDMVVLGVVLLDIELEVIVYILQIIIMIEQLIGNGYVYVVEGYVLFVVVSFDGYGKFLCCDFDEMLVGVCVDVVLYKCDLGDFVLWKLFSDDLFGWELFWGCGCLGWYIECLVMVVVYLGEIIDIYVGGVDLQFLYYENEFVQSECVYGGKIFVCFWLYNGMFNFGGVKMSKLLGNIECVYDLVCQYLLEVLCLVLLLVYYWQLLDWFDVLIE